MFRETLDQCTGNFNIGTWFCQYYGNLAEKCTKNTHFILED